MKAELRDDRLRRSSIAMGAIACASARGMTFRDFAAACAIHESNIGRFARGSRTPGVTALTRLVSAVDLPLELLEHAHQALAWVASTPSALERLVHAFTAECP